MSLALSMGTLLKQKRFNFMLLGFHCSAVIKEAGAVSQAVKREAGPWGGGLRLFI